jgi:transposase InsO family protein
MEGECYALIWGIMHFRQYLYRNDQTSTEMEWFGIRRKDRESVQHHTCCFGINHHVYLGDHHLYMVDVVPEDDQHQELIPHEAEDRKESGTVQSSTDRLVLRTHYYDKQQQLEMVLTAQRLLEAGEHGSQSVDLDEEEECAADSRGSDIWEDSSCMELLQGGVLPTTIDSLESKRTRKRILNYHWQGQSLYFKGLLVPKPEDRMEMHRDLGHFGEERTLAEVCRRYFWHNRTENVKEVVRVCQQCQMVRRTGGMRSEDEELKSIPVCDLFYRVALDTAGPLLETRSGNRYILVAIDHYSKWCEAKAVADHGAKTITKFLEDDVICRYEVPKFVLIDNGGEWAAEFDAMCKDYGIHHQHTTPQWPQCNGMAERLIKTIKHGIMVLSAAPDNANCWDEQLAKVMFGYRCGIQSSTKFSPFMILTGRTPRLRADNYLDSLTAEIDDTADVETTTKQFMQKVKLITSIHENVLINVEQAQQKQKRAYATRKGKQAFEGLISGETMVKMKKPGKKKALTASWEGPYLFVAHTDGIGNLDFEEGSRVCVVQDVDGNQWEKPRRDLQVYYAPQNQKSLGT